MYVLNQDLDFQHHMLAGRFFVLLILVECFYHHCLNFRFIKYVFYRMYYKERIEKCQMVCPLFERIIQTTSWSWSWIRTTPFRTWMLVFIPFLFWGYTPEKYLHVILQITNKAKRKCQRLNEIRPTIKKKDAHKALQCNLSHQIIKMSVTTKTPKKKRKKKQSTSHQSLKVKTDMRDRAHLKLTWETGHI